MTVYHTILSDVPENETARYAGLGDNPDFPAALLREACLEARLLIAPRAAWEIYSYSNHTIEAERPLILENPSIINHLSGCRKIIVLALTIGDALEKKAAALFEAGNYTAGLLLDAAGSAAVEAAADKVNDYLTSLAAREGLHSVMRFSPGYGDWKITVQPRLLELAGSNQIGLSAAPSCMLVPRKSITAVIGLKDSVADTVPVFRCRQNCATCSQNNCLARKEHSS